MPISLSRRLVWAAGVLVLLAFAAGLALYWYQRGPGLDREVQRLVLLAQVRPGMTAAEIGAGQGRMAVRMARRIGPAGRLYVTEIDGGLLEKIREAATAHGLGNVSVIEGGERASGLPEACCEVIYMRRVYHHLTDAPSILQSLHAALRPDGRLAVIDFLSPAWMPGARHGIARDAVAGQVTSAGFLLDRRVDGWSPIDYCLVFRKTSKPPPVSKPE